MLPAEVWFTVVPPTVDDIDNSNTTITTTTTMNTALYRTATNNKLPWYGVMVNRVVRCGVAGGRLLVVRNDERVSIAVSVSPSAAYADRCRCRMLTGGGGPGIKNKTSEMWLPPSKDVQHKARGRINVPAHRHQPRNLKRTSFLCEFFFSKTICLLITFFHYEPCKINTFKIHKVLEVCVYWFFKSYRIESNAKEVSWIQV